MHACGVCGSGVRTKGVRANGVRALLLVRSGESGVGGSGEYGRWPCWRWRLSGPERTGDKATRVAVGRRAYCSTGCEPV